MKHLVRGAILAIAACLAAAPAAAQGPYDDRKLVPFDIAAILERADAVELLGIDDHVRFRVSPMPETMGGMATHATIGRYNTVEWDRLAAALEDLSYAPATERDLPETYLGILFYRHHAPFHSLYTNYPARYPAGPAHRQAAYLDGQTVLIDTLTICRLVTAFGDRWRAEPRRIFPQCP